MKVEVPDIFQQLYGSDINVEQAVKGALAVDFINTGRGGVLEAATYLNMKPQEVELFVERAAMAERKRLAYASFTASADLRMALHALLVYSRIKNGEIRLSEKAEHTPAQEKGVKNRWVPLNDEDTKIILESLLTNALICYARPFIEEKGLTNAPKQTLKWEDVSSGLYALSQKEMEFHQWLIETMRSRKIAHSGAELFSAMESYKEGKVVRGSLGSLVGAGFESQADDFYGLANRVWHNLAHKVGTQIQP